jgi:chain length determinant protein EpsF
MSLGQFFSILRARWQTAALVLLIVVGGTLLGSLVWPKKYTALASVVVDSKPDPISAMIYQGLVSPAFMATQVDIIQSDRVALRVVRDLKLADNPQIRQQWRDETGGDGSIESWLADSFQTAMDVKPSRESNVITVSYKSPDPRFAAGLANAFVQAYIETVLELKVDPAKQYGAFFDNQAKAAREVLEKAQSKLSAFQREKGIVASDERIDVENNRLNELSSQLVAVQAVASESQSRSAQARGAGADTLQEVMSNPVVGSLKSDISRAEAQLQALNARLGDRNPQVVELKANIAELRTRLAEETRRATGGVGVSNTINQQREAQIRADLEAQRSKVLRMKQVRDEGSVLVKDVDNAEKSYDAIAARLTQSTLESQATQSNINVLTPATPPLKPSSPKIIINTLVALFLGTMLAVGIALLREFMDRRVRAPEDIFAALGLPVIGLMPRPNARRLIGGGVAGPSLMQQRVVGHLSAPSKGAA